jgi:regulator of replication initiation timing
MMLNEDISNKIVEFERQLKAIKQQEDELKQAILEEMELNGIVKFEDENNGLSITYVAETTRETFDSKTFRKEYPDVYDEYVKMSPVKSSIRIKVKEI